MLGNSRFLIIVISAFLAVALLCLGASASDLTREEMELALREGEPLRIAPADFQYPPRKVFSSVPFIGTIDGINSTRGTDMYSIDVDHSLLVTFCSVQCQNTLGVWQSAYTASFDEPTEVYFGHANGWLYFYVDGQRVDNGWYDSGRIRCAFYNEEEELSLPSAKFQVITIPPLFDLRGLFSGFVAVWNKVVTFVTSSWVVLVPVVAFVCFLGFGVIRRLVKGV